MNRKGLLFSLFFKPHKTGDLIKNDKLTEIELFFCFMIPLLWYSIMYVLYYLKLVMPGGEKTFLSISVSFAFKIAFAIYIYSQKNKIDSVIKFFGVFYVLDFGVGFYVFLSSFFGALIIPLLFPTTFMLENLDLIVRVLYESVDILFFIYCINYVYGKRVGRQNELGKA